MPSFQEKIEVIGCWKKEKIMSWQESGVEFLESPVPLGSSPVGSAEAELAVKLSWLCLIGTNLSLGW
jgi:hypothetical protein